MVRKLAFLVAFLALAWGGTAIAQQTASSAPPKPDPDKGFVSIAEFGGSVNSSGHVLKLDTSAGYNFSRHFGFSFGIPFYFAGASSTSSTGTKTNYSTSGIGAPYADLHLTFQTSALTYGSRVRTFFPAGAEGLSNRQTSFDWNNHLERSFGRFTPFGEAGVGNTVADTSRFNRPYSSYGYNAHVQAGAIISPVDRFALGGSAYDILPWGTQTLYSRTLPKNTTAMPGNAPVSSKRVFDQSSVVTGTSSLAEDYGFSAFADFSPARYVTAELGYTRSVIFELDTVSFSLRLDLGYLARRSTH